MSGMKRNALTQGGKDGLRAGFDDAQTIDDKPSRATAAQLATRKIASLKKKNARPAGSAFSVPLPASNPFANNTSFGFGGSSGGFGSSDANSNGASSAPTFGGFGSTSGGFNSTPSFSFGASIPPAADSNTQAAPFSFGSSFGGAANLPTTASSAPNPFSFGSATAGSPSPTPSFSFGSVNNDQNQASTGNTKPASFSFGAAPSATTAAKEASPAPSFTFGTGAASSTANEKAASPAPTFSFGASQPAASTNNEKAGSPAPTFSFGASQAPVTSNTEKAGSPAPLFSFGSTTAPATSQNEKAASPAPSFTFGSNTTPGPATTTNIAGDSAKPSLFSFSSQPAGNSSIGSRSRSGSPAKSAPAEKKSMFSNSSFPTTSPAPAGQFNFFGGDQSNQAKPINFFGSGSEASKPVSTEVAGKAADPDASKASQPAPSKPSLFGQSLPAFEPKTVGSDLFSKAASTAASFTPKPAFSGFSFPPAKNDSSTAVGTSEGKPKASESVSTTPTKPAPTGNLFSFAKPAEAPPVDATPKPPKPAKEAAKVDVPPISGQSFFSGGFPKSTTTAASTPSTGSLGFKPTSTGAGGDDMPPISGQSLFSAFGKPKNISSSTPTTTIPSAKLGGPGNKDFTASPADKAAPKFSSPAKTTTPAASSKSTVEPPAAARTQRPGEKPVDTAKRIGVTLPTDNEACTAAYFKRHKIPDYPEDPDVKGMDDFERAQYAQCYRIKRLNVATKRHLQNVEEIADWTPMMKYYINVMESILQGGQAPGKFGESIGVGGKRKAEDDDDETREASSKKVRPAFKPSTSMNTGDVSYPQLNTDSSSAFSGRAASPTKGSTSVTPAKPSAETNGSGSQTSNLFGNLLNKGVTPSKPAAPGNLFSNSVSSGSNLFATPTSSSATTTNFFAAAPSTIPKATSTSLSGHNNLFANPAPKPDNEKPIQGSNLFGNFLSTPGSGTPGMAFSAGGSGASSPFGASLSRAGTVSPAPSTTGGQSVFDSEEHRQTPDPTNLFAKFAKDASKSAEEPDDDFSDENDEDAESEEATGNVTDASGTSAGGGGLFSKVKGRSDGLFGRVSFGAPTGGSSLGATSFGTPSRATSVATSIADESAAEDSGVGGTGSE